MTMGDGREGAGHERQGRRSSVTRVASTGQYSCAKAPGDPDMKRFTLATAYLLGLLVLAVPGAWAQGSVDDIVRDANQGHATAQFFLGFLHDEGVGVPKHKAEAAKWYRRAAQQGHPGAQYRLGLSYRRGKGVSEDGAEAIKWFRLAAEQGHAGAQRALGGMYVDDSWGVPQDRAKALKWYRLAGDWDALRHRNLGFYDTDAIVRHAKDGDAVAQGILGWMYYNEIDLSFDEAKALKWFHRAAEQGDAGAQYWLGYLYYDDFDDEAKALKWYRRAAKQGDAEAQYALGEMYDDAHGIEDDARALSWFFRAAEQGHVKALHRLW